MWGLTPVAGWTSRMKETLHHIGAHEKSNPRVADERLPREIRAEGERRHQQLQAKLENGNSRSPSKLRWLRRRRQEPQAAHDNGSSPSPSKLRWLRRRRQESQGAHDNGSPDSPSKLRWPRRRGSS